MTSEWVSRWVWLHDSTSEIGIGNDDSREWGRAECGGRGWEILSCNGATRKLRGNCELIWLYSPLAASSVSIGTSGDDINTDDDDDGNCCNDIDVGCVVSNGFCFCSWSMLSFDISVFSIFNRIQYQPVESKIKPTINASHHDNQQNKTKPERWQLTFSS